MRIAFRGAALAVAALWAVAGLSAADAQVGGLAAGQDVTLTGTLRFVWGDPLPLGSGESQLRYFLCTDDGAIWDLQVDPAQLAAAGGAWEFNRQRITVRGTVAPGEGLALFVKALALAEDAQRGDADRFRATGPQPYVWILLRFNDDPSTPEQPAWFETQALGPHPSLDDFWREVSFENINLTGSQIAGWYTLPRSRSYYVYDIDPNNPNDEVDFGRCVDDAVALADPDVYFPDFIGVNLCFNGVLDGAAWGGGWNITADGETRGYGVTWMPGHSLGWYTQGILAHEMGHALSLPHSSGPYGGTYDSQWDVMSLAFGTCAVSDPVYGCLGPHTIGYHKDWLSWIPSNQRHIVGSVPEVTTLLLHDLAVAAPAGRHHYLRIPAGTDMFYTVEARRLTGYDQNIPGPAVVLHKVDYNVDDHARVVDPDGNGDCNDEGARWQAGETFYDGAASVLLTVDWTVADCAQVTVTNTPRATVYVDYANSGSEDGTAAHPWNTVREGHGGALLSGLVYIRPGTYHESLVLSKPATLQHNGATGIVTIGP